jgi:prepilin-type N-terminal cleavage/methylation domain-containing protein
MGRCSRQSGMPGRRLLAPFHAADVCNDHGVTLMELLMVVAVTGILSVALLHLFRAGMMGWQHAAEMTRFQLNTSKLCSAIGRDVRASQQFVEVRNDRIILQQPANRIRFRISGATDQQKIIREVYDPQTREWFQLPRFAVADFTGINVTIVFGLPLPASLSVRVSSDTYQVETSVTKRL